VGGAGGGGGGAGGGAGGGGGGGGVVGGGGGGGGGPAGGGGQHTRRREEGQCWSGFPNRTENRHFAGLVEPKIWNREPSPRPGSGGPTTGLFWAFGMLQVLCTVPNQVLYIRLGTLYDTVRC